LALPRTHDPLFEPVNIQFALAVNANCTWWMSRDAGHAELTDKQLFSSVFHHLTSFLEDSNFTPEKNQEKILDKKRSL